LQSAQVKYILNGLLIVLRNLISVIEEIIDDKLYQPIIKYKHKELKKHVPKDLKLVNFMIILTFYLLAIKSLIA